MPQCAIWRISENKKTTRDKRHALEEHRAFERDEPRESNGGEDEHSWWSGGIHVWKSKAEYLGILEGVD